MDRLLRLLIYVLVWLARYTRRLARMGIGNYEEWRPGKKLKLLLVGYNGARNTGADVRTASIARQLKQVYGPDQVEITIMALNPEGLRPYFDEDVNLYGFTTAFLLPLYRACSVHHAVVIAEGSVLKGTFADALTLYFCEACGIMRSQGKPCIAYGVEAGHMDAFLKKAAADLCRDTYFIARSEASLKVVRSLGLRGHIGTDAAWCYDGAVSDSKAQEWLRASGWDGKKECIGVAVIDAFCWPVRSSLTRYITRQTKGRYEKWYYFSQSEKRSRALERYIDRIARTVNRIAREEDMFPVVIGMEKLDADACRMLQAKLERPCAMLLSADEKADLITGVLRQMDLLVTSRYHAAVLSMERGIPVIALSMDERLDSLMTECGLAEKYLFHTTDKDLGGHLYKAVKDAGNHSEEIGAIIHRQTASYKKQLDQMGHFLKVYIRERLVNKERIRKIKNRKAGKQKNKKTEKIENREARKHKR